MKKEHLFLNVKTTPHTFDLSVSKKPDKYLNSKKVQKPKKLLATSFLTVAFSVPKTKKVFHFCIWRKMTFFFKKNCLPHLRKAIANDINNLSESMYHYQSFVFLLNRNMVWSKKLRYLSIVNSERVHFFHMQYWEGGIQWRLERAGGVLRGQTRGLSMWKLKVNNFYK